jgi:hypothetical protein
MTVMNPSTFVNRMEDWEQKAINGKGGPGSAVSLQ